MLLFELTEASSSSYFDGLEAFERKLRKGALVDRDCVDALDMSSLSFVRDEVRLCVEPPT